MDEHLQQLLLERHDTMMTAITGIHDRLDVLNGRTRQNEKHIAVLHDRQKLLWGGLTAIGAAGLAWVVERFRA
jgi:hypothetical protein